MYDYIIIGGGIAGLYMNALLSKKYKTLLLEKNNYLGGRGIETKFHNNIIKLGAGIAEPQNKHLIKLLNKLKIKYGITKSNINYSFKITFDMKNAINKIKQKYVELEKQNNDDIKNLTVKKFIIKYFGQNFFNSYDKMAEYNDYHNFDMTYFIKYYKIKDHLPTPYKLIYLSWTELINKLCIIIKKNNKIKLNYEVKQIKYDEFNKIYVINNKYKTKNVICATTLNTLDKIIHNSNIPISKYNKYIGTVPFVRVYTYHKNGHNLNIERYSIVDNILEKIIKIDENILMLSYSDNKKAIKLYKLYNKNKEKFIIYLTKYAKQILHQDLIIDDIKFVYWNEGIHYIKPTKSESLHNVIKKLQNPFNNFYVCGEMLSYKQGWVEGSIESVNRVHKIIRKQTH